MMFFLLPIVSDGRTVMRKQTSCLRRFSHSALISFLTLRFTVTSALTLEGLFSPAIKFKVNNYLNLYNNLFMIIDHVKRKVPKYRYHKK